MRKLWFFIALLASLPADAAVFYQRTGGNDTACNGLFDVDHSIGVAPNCAEATISACLADITPRSNGGTCSLGLGIHTNPALVLDGNCGTGAQRCILKATNMPGDITNSSTYSTRLDNNTSATALLIAITGNNWTVSGFYIRNDAAALSGPRLIYSTASTGTTISENRIEIRPGVRGESLWFNGTSNVTVDHNWMHTFPGCINAGQSYVSPWTGATVTGDNCGGQNRCDFNTDSGSIILFNGEGVSSSNLTFTRNDYGHWQNPMRIHNAWTIYYARNKCTNATNHGCLEADDVRGVVMENNIADIDIASNCADEILQSSLFDTYCFDDLVMRNNTSVGHGLGWEQQLDSLAPNAGADARCTDVNGSPGSWVVVGPNVGNCVPVQSETDPDDVCQGGHDWYQHLRIYNNIVYNGKPSSGAAGIYMNMSDRPAVETPPVSIANYNLINLPSGNRAGGDNEVSYVSFASWQAGVGSQPHDVNGLGVAPVFRQYCNTIGSTSCSNYRPPLSGIAPQINAGVNTATLPCPTVDYDNQPRGGASGNGACDIGAFEFQAGGPAEFCGDGIINGADQCEGTGACGGSVLCGGETCASQVPGSTGTLSCVSCAFVTSGCTVPPTTPGMLNGAHVTGKFP